MAGAFTLIAYKSADGTGVTTSPRFARGNTEPELIKDAVVEKIFNDGMRLISLGSAMTLY